MNRLRAHRWPGLALALGYLILAGCSSAPADPVDAFPQLIQGRWDLRTAYRNEQMTQTLSGTFFNFSTPNTLTTNLPIPATAPTDSPIFVGKYRLNRDTVLVEGTVPFRFLIQHLDSTSMILSATFNQQAFQFDLSRG